MLPAVFRLCLGKQAGMQHAVSFQAAAESLKQVAKRNREWSMIGGKIPCRRRKELLLVSLQGTGHGCFHLNLADLAGQVEVLQVQTEQAGQVPGVHAGEVKHERELVLLPLAPEAAEELQDSPVAASE